MKIDSKLRNCHLQEGYFIPLLFTRTYQEFGNYLNHLSYTDIFVDRIQNQKVYYVGR